MTDLSYPEGHHEPIALPDPRLIEELFDKDPLELSDQDLDVIIASFRADRVSYLQPTEKKPAKAKKAKAISADPDLPITQDLLADLGL